jgi:hypothetical protein
VLTIPIKYYFIKNKQFQVNKIHKILKCIKSSPVKLRAYANRWLHIDSHHYISDFMLFHSDLRKAYEKGNNEKLINFSIKLHNWSAPLLNYLYDIFEASRKPILACFTPSIHFCTFIMRIINMYWFRILNVWLKVDIGNFYTQNLNYCWNMQAELHATPLGQLTAVSPAYNVLDIAAEHKVSGRAWTEPQGCLQWQPESHRLDIGKEWFERISRTNAIYNFIFDTLCLLRNHTTINLPIWFNYI